MKEIFFHYSEFKGDLEALQPGDDVEFTIKDRNVRWNPVKTEDKMLEHNWTAVCFLKFTCKRREEVHGRMALYLISMGIWRIFVLLG